MRFSILFRINTGSSPSPEVLQDHNSCVLLSAPPLYFTGITWPPWFFSTTFCRHLPSRPLSLHFFLVGRFFPQIFHPQNSLTRETSQTTLNKTHCPGHSLSPQLSLTVPHDTSSPDLFMSLIGLSFVFFTGLSASNMLPGRQ